MFKIIKKLNGKFLATDGDEYKIFDSVLYASPYLIDLAFYKYGQEITLFDIAIVEEEFAI